MNPIEPFANWNSRAMAHLLRELIESVRVVCFDFDGPICKLFHVYSAEEIADAMKRVIRRHGLSVNWREKDPHAIYRYAAASWQNHPVFRELDALLTRTECLAALTAERTLLYRFFVEFLLKREKQTAITTNNSPKAVEVFSRRPDENSYPLFEGWIFGRTEETFDRMKPDPCILQTALETLHSAPKDALMIGNAVTDFQAAQRAGTAFLGYAQTDTEYVDLKKAGVSVIIPSYTWVFQAFGVWYPSMLVLDDVEKYY
ncbi:HAD hydrolase-like protein [Shimazuella sp. AN120528]|uniref:HAD family hydrolase n=1 Tax=Shimazuella soli TaxID=1892854 RepID=UPI001F10E551|nr:HAD family hydrolase [Shimazuella soli]MCH5584557.1 HAD hydrolase-like protein [Shimazuella soli]